jgi:RNA recognition motif-containing protein
MGNRLYIGNIPFAATNESLTQYFSQAGTVTEASVMIDKFTGRSRGFAFVTMATDAEAANAISMFHGKAFEGRPITVNEAKPREERPAGGGFGGGGRGPGGGGRGGGRGDRPPRREFGGGGGGRDRGERRGGFGREE